jgi:hypothetical protein
MTTLTKALLATGAAAAALISTASPALARERDGIDIGDIIAGAVILGGIATVAGAIGGDRYDRGYSYGYPYEGGYDRYGYNDRYSRQGYYRSGNPRQAVEQCVYAAEREGRRYSYGRADVTDIRSVDRNSRGYTVRGRIAVNTRNRDWRYSDGNYGRGWDNDYRGWDSSLRGYDAGTFKCRVEYGRVVDLDFNGIRGI